MRLRISGVRFESAMIRLGVAILGSAHFLSPLGFFAAANSDGE